jgi:hypothetical protein
MDRREEKQLKTESMSLELILHEQMANAWAAYEATGDEAFLDVYSEAASEFMTITKQ